jgi:hypothetical protein
MVSMSFDETWSLLLVVAHSISVLASVCVIFQIAQLKGQLGSRRTPRLMSCLAGADLLCDFSGTLRSLLVLATSLGLFEPHIPEKTIWVLSHGFTVGFAISIWLELLVCITFLMRSFRSARCLAPWLPLLAAIMVCVDISMEIVHNTPCSEVTKCCMVFTSTVSMLCLGVAAWRSKTSADVVEKRAVLQAGVYAINVLATQVPTVTVLMLWMIGGIQFSALTLCADCLLSLKGLANACTFFWQSRYSSQTIHDVARRQSRAGSFDVSWGDAEVVFCDTS